MIAYKQLKCGTRSVCFLRRWHRQSGWRMSHQSTRRMQMNTHRWYCVLKRKQREMLLAWARAERSGYAACINVKNRFPSNEDLPRSHVHWHMANVYARVGLGEDKEIVLREEEAQLLIKIRAYNEAQERIWGLHTSKTWTTGCQGYYSEEEAQTKMRHARTMMRAM